MTFSSNDPTYMQRQMKEKPPGSQASSLVPGSHASSNSSLAVSKVESEYTFTHGTDILDPAFSSWGGHRYLFSKDGTTFRRELARFTKC